VLFPYDPDPAKFFVVSDPDDGVVDYTFIFNILRRSDKNFIIEHRFGKIVYFCRTWKMVHSEIEIIRIADPLDIIGIVCMQVNIKVTDFNPERTSRISAFS
jgi:hypothetical protein